MRCPSTTSRHSTHQEGPQSSEPFLPVPFYCRADSFSVPALPNPSPPHSKAKINFSAAKEVESGEQIYVFYAEEFSVGIKTMRKCVPTLRALCPYPCSLQLVLMSRLCSFR